ncbi:MAG: type IV pilin protein [Desulfovibrionaceae bacterium]|nr:type IV pilin protein [Desulfovibrionaceae bacterium]
MQRARRTDATRALTEVAAAMERYFSQNQTYATAGLGAASANVYPATSPEGYYNLAISSASATQYTLTATPKPGGPQVSDTQCGNFILNSASQRSVSGTLSAKDCWKLN